MARVNVTYELNSSFIIEFGAKFRADGSLDPTTPGDARFNITDALLDLTNSYATCNATAQSGSTVLATQACTLLIQGAYYYEIPATILDGSNGAATDAYIKVYAVDRTTLKKTIHYVLTAGN